MASEYTVTQLKELARARNLPTSGTKADLFARLEEFDPEIWRTVAQEKITEQENEDANKNNIELADVGGERSLKEREMEFLKREQDLLQREVELLRAREEFDSRSSTNSPNTMNGDQGQRNASSNMSIRAIGDLLTDYDGCASTFWRWEQQVQLLRESYTLNEQATRVLISSKLKGRAADWFHSKSEHLSIEVDSLLSRMKTMFDHRPSKLTLRKDFETRVWKCGEPFADYFHDKIILANRVPIEEEEIIDYLVDGVSDQQLQDQARMMRFKTKADILEAFGKITLTAKKTMRSEPKIGQTRSAMSSGGDREVKKSNRCFSCNEVGHISAKCPKPQRPPGSCFECGSTTHQLRDCPKKKRPVQRSIDKREASVNAVETNYPAPYLPTVKFSMKISKCEKRAYVVKALLDSGSPISLIKSSLIPTQVRSPPPNDNVKYSGINGSRLSILGLFWEEVEVEGIMIKIKFYVVPDEAMSAMIILGRDFLYNPSISITLGETFIINKKDCAPSTSELEAVITEFSEIDCFVGQIEENEKLQINPDLDSNIQEKIKQIYDFDFIKKRDSNTFETDYEMKIVLKHNQPISARPRRLSYADTQKLQIILDDLLKRKIIRPSASPYASPIVLTKKKNGEPRLCADYRELNKITVKDNFPSSLIDDNIDRLKNKKYFTTLDLKDGYYIVKMAKESIPLTAFVTPLGQFEFLYCPFGLTNAPKVFARFIRQIFSHLLKHGKILIFFDDFLVATETIDVN